MKKRKIAKAALAVLSIMTIGASGASLAACGHKHSYGYWEITQNPTLSDVGKAERKCVDNDDTQSMQLPALNDTSFWTENTDAAVAATHEADGSRTFTSEYGTVTITVPKGEHSFGTWEITQKPTLNEQGKAKHKCDTDNYEQEIAIPKLSDSSVWTEKSDEHVNPTHTAKGKAVYESVYGKVEIELPADANAHEFGIWTFVDGEKPTLEKSGRIQHSCTVSEAHSTPVVEYETVAKLTEESEWSYNEKTPATHTTNGLGIYTHKVYEVEVEVTIPANADAHNWNSWGFVEVPTLTDGGKIRRTCGEENLHPQEEDVAPLSDEREWTVDVTKAPNHQQTGLATYTHKLYDGVKVEGVVIVKVAHNYEGVEWTIDVEPTDNTQGKATRHCSAAECANDEHAVDTLTLPVLTSSFWTKHEVAADYNHGSGVTYTNEEHNLTIVHENNDKKVAPYDNKTYYATEISTNENNGNVSFYVRNSASAALVVDANGVGVGEGYPFNGTFTFEMINADAKTGYVKITSGSDVEYAYVDMVTGVFVMSDRGTWGTPMVVIPTTDEAPLLSGFSGAICAGDYIINYTNNDTVYDILIAGINGSYFGISAVNAKGDAVAAENCFKVVEEDVYSYALVVKQGDTVIKGYGFDGEEWVVAKGPQGVYTIEGKSVLVNGAGLIAIVEGSEVLYSGNYRVEGDKIGFIADDDEGRTYYELTLNDEDGTCTAATPKVTITIEFNGYTPTGLEGTNLVKALSKYVPVEIGFEHESMLFMGLYYDAACTDPVQLDDNAFVPVENVTLYIKWASKLVVHLHNLLDANADSATLYFGEGEIIGEKLGFYTKYETIDEVNNTYFEGWYLDEGFKTALPMNAEISAEEDGLDIYAHWVAIPKYVGNHVLHELVGLNSISGSVAFGISISGKITGDLDGQVVSYDATTMELICQSETASFTLFFDAESGLMFAGYEKFGNSNTFAVNDVYVGGVGVSSADIETYAIYRIYGTNYVYFVRLIEYKGQTIVLSDDGNGAQIFTDVTVKNGLGEDLTIATVKTSKTLVIREASTNEIIVAIASLGSSFNEQVNNTDLDAYFGIYKHAENDDIVVDGAGSIKMGTKSGTYTLAATGSNYTLDVYLSNETEYIRVTLNTTDNTYTFTKPVVSISFNAHGYAANPEAVDDANINVVYELPQLTNESGEALFRGWYFDEDLKQAVPENWKPEEKTGGYTLHAKWDVKATVKFNFNAGDGHPAETVNDLYVGDKLGDKLPEINFENGDKVFIGWFTKDGTESGDWGEEVTAETVIPDVSVEFFAKWIIPPIYAKAENADYGALNITGSSSSGTGSKNFSYGKITFNADNTTTNNGYPFNGYEISVTYFDEVNGIMYIDSKSSNFGGLGVHKAFIDLETAVIVFNKAVGVDSDISTIFILLPNTVEAGVTDYKESYWNSGKTRAVSFTWRSNTYTIFVHNNEVYFGASFKTAEGTAVEANAAYRSETLYVWTKAEDGELIAKFGYSGGVMNTLDGYEEITYVYSGEGEDLGDISVNGVKTITTAKNGTGTYTLVEGAAYTADVYVGGSYYELTIDKANKKYTAVKPMVMVTFVTEHDSENAVSGEKNKNIEFALPTLTAEGFVFRGWYKDGDQSKLILGGEKFEPKEAVTFTAKWDSAAVVTFHYNDGNAHADHSYSAGYVNDKIGSDNIPKVDFGYGTKVFAGWFTKDGSSDDEWGVQVTGDTVISDVEVHVYAKWVEPHALMGVYKGYESWGASSTGAKTFEVDALGNVTWSKTNGVIEEYDEELGTFVINSNGTKRYAYYDALSQTIVTIDSSGTVLSNDVHILTRVSDSSVTVSISDDATKKVVKWDSNYTQILRFTVGGTEKSFFVWDNKVYGNVTVMKGTTVVADLSKLSEMGIFAIYNASNQVIARFQYNGTTYVKVESTDGTEGSYSGDLGEIVLDGYGNLTISGKTVDYTVVDGNLHFIVDNAMHIISLGDGTYTQVLDGYQGEYTLPNGVDKITLDGFGGAGDGATYVVNGKAITIFKDGNETKYEIDVSAKTLSEFAAFTAEGKAPTTSGKVFSYNEEQGAWLTKAESSGDAYLAIHIFADGTLTFKWKALEDDNDNYPDASFRYTVYDTETNKSIGSEKTISNAELDGPFDSLSWKSYSIDVKAGTTIYLRFFRSNYAGSKAQAGVKDIALN